MNRKCQTYIRDFKRVTLRLVEMVRASGTTTHLGKASTEEGDLVPHGPYQVREEVPLRPKACSSSTNIDTIDTWLPVFYIRGRSKYLSDD